MPNSTWTETGASISLAPSVTPVSVSSSPEDVNYLTNSDKITLMAQYSAELATKTSLDETAASLGVSSSAYDNAVALISATLTDAGAPANWATVWPDGTTFGPVTGIQTSLANDWEEVASQRAALHSSIAAANAAAAQAAAVASAASDATTKMNQAISTAVLKAQIHPVAWDYASKPALPSASYPAGYVAQTSDNRTVQVSADGATWDDVLYSVSGLFGKINAGLIEASAVTSDAIAAGAITVNKLAVTSTGLALNADPFCSDATAWAIGDGGSFAKTSVSDGLVGNTALQMTQTNIRSLPIPIAPGKTYRLKIVARGVGSPASACTLRFYQYPGSTVWTPSGWPASPLTLDIGHENFTLADTWTVVTATVSGASTAAWGALSFHASWFPAGGNPIPVQIQDFELAEMADASLIVDGTITTAKITAGGIAADVIKTGTLDASVVTVANINADNITAGTLSAAKVLFGDGTALTSAARVQVSKIKFTGGTLGSASGPIAVPGAGWTVSTASANDVYVISGALNIADSVQGIYNVNVFVDGNTSTDYGLGILLSEVQNLSPFFGSVTGLSAGTHTIQVYVTRTGGGATNAAVGNFIGLCQRFF